MKIGKLGQFAVSLLAVVASITVMEIKTSACDTGTVPTSVPFLGSGYQDLEDCGTGCTGQCFITLLSIDYCGSKEESDTGGCQPWTTVMSAKQGACGAPVGGDARHCGCHNVSPNWQTATVNSALPC